MKKEEKVVAKIKEVIERVRPYLQNDGGDIEFKRFENGVVYVSMVGACIVILLARIFLK